MATGWKRCKLGDVLTLQRGYDLPQRDRREGSVPIVTSSGITGFHDIAKAKGPGVITGRYGTLGEVFYIKEDYWPHNTTLYVRDFKGNDPLFISYFLRTLGFAAQTAAAAVPGVNRNALHLLPVKIPALPTQRRIASILSTYDDLIENNTRRIKILEQMAQAIYREWFVEFRAPGIELRKATPEEQKVTGKDRFPAGWELKQFGDVIELAYGKALKADTRVPGQVPVYGSAGVIGYHNESLVAGPGIIVGRKGNVGSVFWSDEDFFPIDTAFYVVTELNLHYVYYNLQSQNFINNDAAVPGLSRNQAYFNPFVVPESETLSLFGEFIDPLFGQIQNLTKKNANLRRTRDLLLPRLVGGEVDVSELDLETKVTEP